MVYIQQTGMEHALDNALFVYVTNWDTTGNRNLVLRLTSCDIVMRYDFETKMYKLSAVTENGVVPCVCVYGTHVIDKHATFVSPMKELIKNHKFKYDTIQFVEHEHASHRFRNFFYPKSKDARVLSEECIIKAIHATMIAVYNSSRPKQLIMFDAGGVINRLTFKYGVFGENVGSDLFEGLYMTLNDEILVRWRLSEEHVDSDDWMVDGEDEPWEKPKVDEGLDEYLTGLALISIVKWGIFPVSLYISDLETNQICYRDDIDYAKPLIDDLMFSI